MDTSREPRDRYAAAGKAGREAVKRAVTQRALLKPRDYRVLLACLALTALYSRTKEKTSVGQIAGLSELSYGRTSESLVRLHDVGVIVWRGTRTRGASGASRVSLVGATIDHERMLQRRMKRSPNTPKSAIEGEEACPF